MHMDLANQKIMGLELENKMLKARVEELGYENMIRKKHRRSRSLKLVRWHLSFMYTLQCNVPTHIDAIAK
jgi:hypothetical protein